MTRGGGVIGVPQGFGANGGSGNPGQLLNSDGGGGVGPDRPPPDKPEEPSRLTVCATAYFGIDGLPGRAGVAAAGAPIIPKSLFGPVTPGSSSVVTPLSVAGHFVRVSLPFRAFGTTNLLRMAGRAAGPAALGMVIADAAAIATCTVIDQ